MKIRTGIIGMGVMGEVFIRCLKNISSLDLVAIADINPDVLKTYAKPGVKGYLDYREMFKKESLDAVLILTPDQYHLEPVLAARDAGAHIFLEKPLATDIEDGKRIVNIADGYDKVFLVGHTLRYDPRIATAYDAIASGRIGELLHIRVWRNSIVAHPIRLKGRCSVIKFIGVHDIDAINWFVGRTVKRVSAMSVSKKLKSLELDTPDAFFATLEYENGVIVQISSSWVMPPLQGKQSNFRAKGIEVVGTSGMISIETDHTTGIVIQTEEDLEIPDVLHQPQVQGKCFGIYSDELWHFLACIEGRAKPATTVRDAYYALAVAHAIEESARTGKMTEIENL